MFKRISVFITLLTFLLSPSIAIAQTQDMMIAPYPGSSSSFLGQHHAYTVVFRGNGEAVVSARVALTNEGKEPLKEVELRLPSKVISTGFTAYQVIREERPCLRYETPERVSNNIYIPPVCAEYGEPDYYQTYGASKYSKLETNFSGDTLKITLANEIKAGFSGAYFVHFRATGFAKKNLFGAYDFNFETFKVSEGIQQLTLGINTDSDLVIKGGQGSVDYRYSDVSSSLPAIAEDQKLAASAAIDNFYSQIGYGTINKQASGLAALETYKVDGMYGVNNFQLYAKEIVIGLLVLIGLIIVIYIIARFIIKRSSGSQVKPRSPYLMVFLVSFASTVLTGIFTGALMFAGQVIGSNYYYNQYIQFMSLMLVVIGFAVYALLIIGPAVFIGVRNGVLWGISTLGLTIFMLVILSFVAFAFFFLNSRGGSPVMPYYGKADGIEVQQGAPAVDQPLLESTQE